MPRYTKPLIFMLCLIPLMMLGWDGFHHALGANPIEKITHRTGDWSLRFLLITLSITPLRKITGWKPLIRIRRMLGLFTFFYVCIHFSIWIVFDHFFDVNEIMKDIIKRPYITVGFTAFMLLIPLAVTSTNRMMKQLGKRWKQLHQLVYIIAVLGVLHYLWLVKADVLQPVIHAIILLMLLSIRAWYQRRESASLTSGIQRQQA